MSNSPISPSTSIQRKPDMASAVVETAASEEPREEALAGEDDDPVHPQVAEVTHDDDDGDLQRQADEDVEKVKLAPNPRLLLRRRLRNTTSRTGRIATGANGVSLLGPWGSREAERDKEAFTIQCRLLEWTTSS